jgi:hypothetical protein
MPASSWEKAMVGSIKRKNNIKRTLVFISLQWFNKRPLHILVSNFLPPCPATRRQNFDQAGSWLVLIN